MQRNKEAAPFVNGQMPNVMICIRIVGTYRISIFLLGPVP